MYAMATGATVLLTRSKAVGIVFALAVATGTLASVIMTATSAFAPAFPVLDDAVKWLPASSVALLGSGGVGLLFLHGRDGACRTCGSGPGRARVGRSDCRVRRAGGGGRAAEGRVRDMTVVLAGLACGVAGVALAALVYERQLRRLARSLRERDAHSNTRLTVEAPGRGFAELAAAVNGQLDAAREERVEALRRQREFQRDLASLSHDVRTPLMGAKGYVRLAQDGRERPGDEGSGSLATWPPPKARLDDMQALLDQLFRLRAGERSRPRARPAPRARAAAARRRAGGALSRLRRAGMGAAGGFRGRGACDGRRPRGPCAHLREPCGQCAASRDLRACGAAARGAP